MVISSSSVTPPDFPILKIFSASRCRPPTSAASSMAAHTAAADMAAAAALLSMSPVNSIVPTVAAVTTQTYRQTASVTRSRSDLSSSRRTFLVRLSPDASRLRSRTRLAAE